MSTKLARNLALHCYLLDQAMVRQWRTFAWKRTFGWRKTFGFGVTAETIYAYERPNARNK